MRIVKKRGVANMGRVGAGAEGVWFGEGVFPSLIGVGFGEGAMPPPKSIF